jgi:pilus assembly protein Flp/PilA
MTTRLKVKNIAPCMKRFIHEEDGLTTVEYAVAGTLIGLAVVAAFTQLGNAVGNSINEIENVLEP